MQHQFIDGVELHRLLIGGYRNLKKNMTAVNDLNVFPVPDGDTGTNMVKSFGGGLLSTPDNISNVGEYMQKLSRSVLLNARGNSGVIFSQFVHGLARSLKDKETIEFADLIDAFTCAKEDAYGAIITPTEGTILTLIREAAEFLKASGDRYADFDSGFTAIIAQMKVSLAKTPDLLPVLAEAGVVDSGGAGLLCFMEGIHTHIIGGSVEDTPEIADSIATATGAANFGPDSVLEYGYCTEFILQLMNYKTSLGEFNLDEFTAPLKELGDSIVAVHSDGIVKIHIHTFTPELALAHGRKYGEFISVKIENMSIQHSEIEANAASEATPVEKEKLKYAIVAVASGAGIIDYFYNIGANAVIDGGQTDNPSVDDFLAAFDKFDAEHIIVLPNNSNIILTANQAADMYDETDVVVIPTKSVVEGYSALSMMNPWCESVEEFVDDMTSGLSNVTSGYVTTAIRDAVLGGTPVSKGEYIGLDGKTLMSKGNDRIQTAVELIRRVNEQSPKEVVIVFYGEGVGEDEVAALEGAISEILPAADIGMVNGSQSVYDFIISLE